MKYLLDTHIFLWRILDPDRLSTAQRSALDDAQSELFLSAVSAWEVLVLARKGRLSLRPGPRRFLQRALTESPIQIAPITLGVAVRSESIKGFRNPDPADRFIVATGLQEDMCIITADRKIRACKEVETLA